MSVNEVSIAKMIPDWDTLVSLLQANLTEREDAWNSLLAVGTGEALLEFAAAIGTMLQYGVNKSHQESYNDSAGLDITPYRIARMLGVNPQRNISARVFTSLQVTDAGTATPPFIIPKYSQLSVDGVPFYNEEELIFNNINEPASYILVQGSIQKARLKGNGQPYQTFALGKDFTISEDLMYVEVAGQPFDRKRQALWDSADSSQVFLDSTMADGSVNIVFPNSLYGVVPSSSDNIDITYAESLGVEGNKPQSGLEITLSDDLGFTLEGTSVSENIQSVVLDTGDAVTTQFTGTLNFAPLKPGTISISTVTIAGPVTLTDDGTGLLTSEDNIGAAPSTIDYVNGDFVLNYVSAPTGSQDITATYTPVYSGAPSGGADAETPELLKFTVPRLFASVKRAVRRDDWIAIALRYSGDVVDGRVWAEYETSNEAFERYNANAMNVVNVSLLTRSGVQPTESEVRNYFEDTRFHNSLIQVYDPMTVPNRLSLSVYAFSGSLTNALTSNIRNAVKRLFSIRLGALGAAYYRSDIVDLIKSFEGVDYVIIDNWEAIQSPNLVYTDVGDGIALRSGEYAELLDVDLTITMALTDR